MRGEGADSGLNPQILCAAVMAETEATGFAVVAPVAADVVVASWKARVGYGRGAGDGTAGGRGRPA